MPASKALTACCTAPPIFTEPTWMCQVRFGSFSIAIMQLTDTTEMPSTSACPVAGSSGYVARPSMSDMCSPESATASFTAVSACAASGISAVRDTFEYPTPLIAILHRFSHIGRPLLFDLHAKLDGHSGAPRSGEPGIHMSDANVYGFRVLGSANPRNHRSFFIANPPTGTAAG